MKRYIQKQKMHIIQKNPFAVYPEVEGIDFDVEEAKLY